MYVYAANLMSGATAPRTPVKSSTNANELLRDSPFSDYFTDDAASPDTSCPPTQHHAASQQLLARLDKLHTRLSRRETSAEAMNIIGRKVTEIESELGALHSQTRQPPEMEDSGLFMDDDDDDEVDINANGDDVKHDQNRKTADSLDVRAKPPPFDVTLEQKKAENDFLLLEAQKVLATVTKAREALQQRYVEECELHAAHLAEAEEREEEVERLRSENAELKTDLVHDHNELLFLKVQLRAIENDRSPVSGHPIRSEIEQGTGALRRDWLDVSARFKRRRATHGVPPGDQEIPELPENSETASDEQKPEGDWRLEAITRHSGKVQNLTIRRLGSDGQSPDPDGLAEPDASPLGPETESATPTAAATYSKHGDRTHSGAFPTASALDQDRVDEDDDDAVQETDCAITTSSSSPTPSSLPSPDTSPARAPLQTSTWQNFWDDLADLAGLGEDRYG